MTKLLEIRERIRAFYGRFEVYITPAIRFVLALIAFLMVNGTLGYMRKLDNPVVALVLALICTFLPINVTVLLGAILILAHLSALSLEVCAVAFLLFLLLFLMYFKFSSKNGFNVVLTPVLCQLRIAEILPTTVGLRREPYAVLSTVCGIVIYYFLKGIHDNASVLGAVEEDAQVSKFGVALQQIIGNKELYVVVAAFVLTTIVVYVIRRQSFARSWTVAVGVGNAVNLLVLLLGSFWTGARENILWHVIGTVAAVIVGLLMEFFLFHLDYSRTEYVQFEDDEYYYYVKAVPKVFLSTKEKQIKQINPRKDSGITKKELADEFDIDQDLLND